MSRRLLAATLTSAALLTAPSFAAVREQPPSCACRLTTPSELACEARAVPQERPRWSVIPLLDEGWGDRARGWMVYLYPEPASAGYAVMMRAGGRWIRCEVAVPER